MKFRHQSIAKWNGKEIPPNFVHEWIEREERKRALRAESATTAAKAAKEAAAADATATSEAAAAATTVPPTPPPSPPAATTPMTAAALNSEVVVSESRVGKGKRISRSARDPSMPVLLWYYPIARKNFLLITFNWGVVIESELFMGLNVRF